MQFLRPGSRVSLQSSTPSRSAQPIIAAVPQVAHRRRPGRVSLTAFDRAAAVAAIATEHADDVDRRPRFPDEAMAAIRSARLLGAMIPVRFGGEGASVSEMVDVCFRLGGACASTAMIFAMHQINLACLIRHGGKNAWCDDFLRRVALQQLLVASSTTEGQSGGNIRSSASAIETRRGRIHLQRDASVMSFGAQADAIITTARRHSDATSSDQVLAAFEASQVSLEETLRWDALGMRGTCSAGFNLRAAGAADQVLADPYEAIHARTMTPFAHLMWAGVWGGIAADAVERTRRHMRAAARASGGVLPPGAPHLAKASRSLTLLRSMISANLGRFTAIADDAVALTAIEFQNAICLLKVEASELAVSTVMSALRACGLAGYRNDTPASMGRLLRDVLSSPIMINNDRMLANVTASTLVTPTPLRVSD